jgi:hypothetical protein
MKTIRTRTLFLSLFLVFPILLSGQISGDQFVSDAYRFTVSLPAKPTERRESNIEILEYDVFGEYIRWNDVPGTFVSLEAYEVSGENPTLTPAEKVKVVAEYKKANVAEFKKLGVMTQEAPFIFGAIKGTEVRGVLSTSKLVVRMFFLKDRLFVLSASKTSAPDFSWHQQILNSFRILTRSEYIAALIGESTPEALPQTPRPARPASDLAAAALKGRVRVIVEEEQGSPKSPRELSSEVHYDADGNLVRQVTYDLGYPSQVTVWGWVDGMRVSQYNFISYPSGEGPNEKEIIQSLMESPISPRAPGAVKRDPRYATRYEFKYDAQNRVAETKQFSNDGELDSTGNTIYGPNTRTTEYNDIGGKTRRVETIDPNGAVIEEKFFDSDGKLEYDYLYKYTLDAKGNWIIRRQSEKTMSKGKSVVKPGPTHFRTIAYHE